MMINTGLKKGMLLAGLVTIAGLPLFATEITFASFQDEGSSKLFSFTNHGSFATLSETASVVFLFGPGISALLPVAVTGPIVANFTLEGTTSERAAIQAITLPGFENVNFVLQPITAFTETFTLPTPVVVSNRSYSNLLTATYTRGPSSSNLLVAQQGSTSISTNASSSIGQNVTFTSDFLDFSADQTGAADITLALNALSQGFDASSLPGFANSFTADASGSFAVDPRPSGALTPEPGTTLLLGSALLSVGMLKRRKGK